MKNFFIVLFVFILGIHLYGQYEAEHWFFGQHAGLDFINGGAPVSEAGGKINTQEGCSSISNPCGDLVLYTDGVRVWNANHEIMLNGTGLLGDSSSTQSGIIVPKPGDLMTYYIFTVDDGVYVPSVEGLNYSVVDMNLDGGLGGIVPGQKNIPLVEKTTEKVTAVASAGNDAVWVITLAPPPTSSSAPYYVSGTRSNTFYAFKVTASGVQETAVISNFGIDIYGGQGYMKVSPDGLKLGVANLVDESVYIFDFNNETGEISNPVLLDIPEQYNTPYGLEFSPDSSKLYVSNKEDTNIQSCLMQFDLANNYNLTVIDTQQNFRSALQLGLDGKIYQPHTISYTQGTNEMSYIANPNAEGLACDYHYCEIQLPETMIVEQGLPPFIQSYFAQIETTPTTLGIINNFEITTSSEMESVYWDFGDGTSATTYPDNPPENTHAQVEHVYDTAGEYNVSLTIHLPIGCDVTLTKRIVIFETLSTLHYCKDPVTGLATIDLQDYTDDLIALQNLQGNAEVHYYLTEDDAYAGINEITLPITTSADSLDFFYTLTDIQSGIQIIGYLYFEAEANPFISEVSRLQLCDDDQDGIMVIDLTQKENEILGLQTNPPYVVHYYHSEADAQDGTNAIANPEQYVNSSHGIEIIWYDIVNTDTGCRNFGSFEVEVFPAPSLNMEEVYARCQSEELEITVPSEFVSYLWSTGETTQSIIVNNDGDYWVTVTNDFGCEYTHSFSVISSGLAEIDNIVVSDFNDSNNNSILVEVLGSGQYQYSLDGIHFQDSNFFEGLSPGTYTVYVAEANGCGVVQKEVILLGAPQFFTPNGDGFNDYWNIINIENYPGSIVYIYDRHGKIISVINDLMQGWDGNYNGKPMPSTDYWFSATIKDSGRKVRQVTGHFALKR